MSSTTSSVTSFQTLPNSNGNNGNHSNGRPMLTSSNFNVTEKEGCLEATILSVYDLPSSEPPLNVTITTKTMTLSSGPPISRHKDKNSFRFSSSRNTSNNNNNNNNGTLKLVAPLRELYKSTVTIRVVYGNATSTNNRQQQRPKTLVTDYQISQLKIHECKWLILNLTEEEGSGAVVVSTVNNNNDDGNDDNTTNTTTNDRDDDVPPTIRIKLQLSGPYRPEIATLVSLSQSWFGFMDHLEAQVTPFLQQISKLLDPAKNSFLKYVTVPTIPLITILVVTSPILFGILIVTLPFLLPILLILLTTIGSVGGILGIIYASTKRGRQHVDSLLHLTTLKESFVSSRAGQTLIYDTGPRPTPVNVLRSSSIVPKGIWSKLLFSLWIDLIGSSSYLIPIIGELTDIGWAPIQTMFIMAMYDNDNTASSSNLKFVSFVEELLPFTDIVPTATIGWAIEWTPKLLLLEQKSGEQKGVARSASPLAEGLLVQRRNHNSSTTTPMTPVTTPTTRP